MLFFVSLIYAFLLFVIPGEIGLNLLALILTGMTGLPSWAWLTLLNIAAYVLILGSIRLSKFSYEQLQLDREQSHKVLRDFLNVRGCHWLNLAGILLIGAGAILLFLKNALPYQFAFLFGAIVLGFADIFHKDKPIEYKEPLPDPITTIAPEDENPDNAGKQVVLEWVFQSGMDGEQSKSIEVNIPGPEYETVKAKEHSKPEKPSGYMRFVNEGSTETVVWLAARLREMSEKSGYSPQQELQNIVSLVRSIRYEDDLKTHGVDDYANYPLETLYEADQGGDCEDHAILAATLLRILGHKVGLFHLKLDECGHLALAVGRDEQLPGYMQRSESGDAYYYVETVPGDAIVDVGIMPSEFLAELKKAQLIAT
jgi:predicted transglutaminase-like cysteine proteinase